MDACREAHESRPPTVLSEEVVALVRRRIGPVAAFRDVVIVDRLPKTRSGKILRKTLRQIVDGEANKVPATIEDATVLDPISALADRQQPTEPHHVLT
ncbi:AMP-binding enzyme [Streptomyces mirabilis]|uniref:AMP-binding enzyme n=1 Tax=Streptomyces mirabilis TaxID=68239 RepID=UPI0033B6D887